MNRRAGRVEASQRGSGLNEAARRSDRGFALPVTLLLLLLLSTAVLLVAVLAQTSTRRLALRRDSLAALYAAESGINEALWRLNPLSKDSATGAQPVLTERAYSPTNPPPPSFSGTLDQTTGTSYRVWVERPDPQRAVIVAEGLRRQARRFLHVEVNIYNLGSNIVAYRDTFNRSLFSLLMYPSGRGPLQLSGLPTLKFPDQLWALGAYSEEPTRGNLTLYNKWNLHQNVVVDGNVEIRNSQITGTIVATGRVTINGSRIVGNVISLYHSAGESDPAVEIADSFVSGSILARDGDVRLRTSVGASFDFAGMPKVNDGLIYANGDIQADLVYLTGLVFATGKVKLNMLMLQGAVVGSSVDLGPGIVQYDPHKVAGPELVRKNYVTPVNWREGFR
ncbi:MAG TPA: hypothetical protein GXX28_10615 [Firmicutes bacterium]|nr:hypothetical protein [Bacillota bacterium]